MIRKKQGFVSTQDGSLEWKPGQTNGMTEYTIIVKHEGREHKMALVSIAGECSIEKIENVLAQLEPQIQKILGERTANLKQDIIRMAKTQ